MGSTKATLLLLAVVCVSSVHRASTAEDRKTDVDSVGAAQGKDAHFGSVLNLFKEVFARSATTSEILTLNLTNLLVLLLLKGILLAIGLVGGLGLGAGTSFLSRSSTRKSKPYFSTDDLRWAAIYLISASDKDYTCLNALACVDPENANDYVTGCKVLLKGARMAHDFIPRFIPYNDEYEEICKNVMDAAFYTGDCDRKYPCALQNTK